MLNTCDMSFILCSPTVHLSWQACLCTPHPHEVAIKINIPQTILDSKESLWSELRKVQENISAQLWGTILTQAPASYSEQLSAYFFLAVLSNKVVFCLWSIFSDLWGIRSQSVSYQPWKYSLSKELHILLLTLTVEAFFFFFLPVSTKLARRMTKIGRNQKPRVFSTQTLTGIH